MRLQQESIRNLQMNFQVPIPNAFLFQTKVGCAVAPDNKGKRRAKVAGPA